TKVDLISVIDFPDFSKWESKSKVEISNLVDDRAPIARSFPVNLTEKVDVRDNYVHDCVPGEEWDKALGITDFRENVAEYIMVFKGSILRVKLRMQAPVFSSLMYHARTGPIMGCMVL
ncbi:protein kinase superfamily protein, partial [Striga asiatica]